MKVVVDGQEKNLLAVWYEDHVVKLVDQRKLPEKIEIFEAKNTEDIAHAIKDMLVRGAPAIGVTAAYGLAMAKLNKEDITDEEDKRKKLMELDSDNQKLVTQFGASRIML